MGQVRTKILKDDAFRSHDHRMHRLGQVLSGWQSRQEVIENMVIESFQAQDLDKIAVLLTEKKALERQVDGLTHFLGKQGSNE